MDGAGEQFLADAGLAFDQHRDAGSCRLLRGAQHGCHGFAAGDDIGKGQPAFAAMADALQFALERRSVERIAQRHLQPFETDRLDHEILRAGAHRRNYIVDAAMGGLHDDGDAQACFTHFCEHAEPVEAGHYEVEHDRVDRLRIRGGQQGHGRIAAIDDKGLIAALLHHVFNQTALNRVVIGNQDGGSHGFSPHATEMYRIGALSPMPINALLNVGISAKH